MIKVSLYTVYSVYTGMHGTNELFDLKLCVTHNSQIKVSHLEICGFAFCTLLGVPGQTCTFSQV